ncbi:hypothetical protein ACTQ3J_11110 [Oscillospiraceae bacterium LCP25S3_E3]|nr:hypothetical protein [Ruminococcus sp.]
MFFFIIAVLVLIVLLILLAVEAHRDKALNEIASYENNNNYQ